MKINLSNTMAVKNGLITMSKQMATIGYKAQEYIVKQIEDEIDVEGNKYPPYSEIWQKRRAEMNLLPTNKVDLTISGHMRRSIDNVKVADDMVTIGLNNVEAQRSALGVLRNKKRPIEFMGLTKKNRGSLISWMWRKFTKRTLKP